MTPSPYRLGRPAALLVALALAFAPVARAADAAGSPAPDATATPAGAAPAATPAPATPASPPAAPALPSAPVPALPAVPAAPGPNVVSVSVDGNVHVPSDQILAVVRTKAGKPLDEATVKADAQAIYDLGFFSSDIVPQIRPRPGGVSVTYRVVENPVITKIVFSGNASVPSDTLLALMDSAPGQVYNLNTFHEDVLRINSYYDKVGFGDQLASHVGSVDIDPKNGVLAVGIREGLAIKDIKIEGDYILPQPKILAALATKPGSVYSDVLRQKDQQALRDLYDKSELTIGNFSGAIDPKSVDLATGTATLVYTIDVARVGAVLITGNAITHDDVIRRQLFVHAGMLLVTSLVKRDYERLNNLGFFDSVEPTFEPGPDPKKPADVTLVWRVKESRPGSFTAGVGYSGGPNGAGLQGQLGLSVNNLHGTGNAVSAQYNRGSRATDASLNVSVPYLGDSPKASRWSASTSLFTNSLTSFYQAYSAGGATISATNPVISAGGSTSGSTSSVGIPVQIQPNSAPVSGLAATYITRSSGVALSVGRRFTPTVTATLGANLQTISNDVTVPLPYTINGNQTILSSTLTNPTTGFTQSNALGINAPSIASTINGQAYNLRSFTVGLLDNTEDDYNNPRHGSKVSLSEEVSLPGLGSAFNYTVTTFDYVRFFPAFKHSAFGVHGQYGTTTGAIPTSKLFVFSDQQLRGYNNVYFGTDELLGQSELRIPLTKDKKFSFVLLGDYGALRIRGAQPVTDQFGNLIENYDRFIYRGDAGIGVRFDVPQLGFRSVRIDLARGKDGTHTSFAIGQSF